MTRTFLPARTVSLAYEGLASFAFSLTVLEGTIFLFEIPTGVVADTFSRRLSVIIGTLLLGLGPGLEGVLPVFGMILMGEVIRGFGHTFTSGAMAARLADEVGEEQVGAVYLRAAQGGIFAMANSLLGMAVTEVVRRRLDPNRETAVAEPLQGTWVVRSIAPGVRAALTVAALALVPTLPLLIRAGRQAGASAAAADGKVVQS